MTVELENNVKMVNVLLFHPALVIMIADMENNATTVNAFKSHNAVVITIVDMENNVKTVNAFNSHNATATLIVLMERPAKTVNVEVGDMVDNRQSNDVHFTYYFINSFQLIDTNINIANY